MASAEAQAFFDRQSPKDRMAIIDSWGGADLTDEWYKNAKAAGAVAAAPAPSAVSGTTSAADAGIQSWGAEIGGSNVMTANMTPEQRARWSMEHINSFDEQSKNPTSRENAFQFWLQNQDKYDSSCPPNAPYRGRAGTCEESPDNCPQGTTLHGSKCVGWDQLPAELGGTGGAGGQGRGGAAAPGAGAAKPAYFGQDDPLQRHLTNLATSGANQFGGATSGGQFAGGGVFTQGQHGAPAAAAPVAPAPAAPAPAANPAAQAALQAFGGGATSAVAPPPAAPAQFFGGPKPAEQVVAPPAYTNTFGGPESAAARAGFQAANRPSGAALLQSNPILSNMTGQQAPALSATATPIQPAPDAFGVQGGGNGSFEDLVNPRRARRDARTSGSWF